MNRSYSRRTLILMLTGAVIALAFLYWNVVIELVRIWSTDDYSSHGFLIPPIAAFLAWERRDRFRTTPIRPSLAGLVLVIASILALAPGVPLFFTRVSLVGAIASVVLMFFGWSRLRTVTFPLAILLLMIPLPAPVFERIELPLRTATSVLSEVFIRAAGVPIVREGNLLTWSNIVLEVARECSGIRSTIALVTIGLVFGYVPESRSWSRFAVAALTVPVVIVTNSIRVAATAISTHYYGPAAARGFVHDLYGWLAFAAAFAIMLLLHRLLFRAAPARTEALQVP